MSNAVAANYVVDHLSDLERSHYVLKSNSRNYWFGLSYNEVMAYKDKFGGNFCIIIYRSGPDDDAYVVPFPSIEPLLRKEYLGKSGRWHGRIDNRIQINREGLSIPSAEYHNAFSFLDSYENDVTSAITDVSNNDALEEELRRLLQRIEAFDRRYREVTPYKQRRVSEEIARPGEITDYLKKTARYSCQVCGESGFLQRNGTPYIEAHHIAELQELVPGSYCSDNIIVVCATCHKKLHYADVSYRLLDSERVSVNINGTPYPISRHCLRALLQRDSTVC